MKRLMLAITAFCCLSILSACGEGTTPYSDMADAGSDMAATTCSTAAQAVVDSLLVKYAKATACRKADPWPPKVPYYIHRSVLCDFVLPERRDATYTTLTFWDDGVVIWYKNNELQGFDQKGAACAKPYKDQSFDGRTPTTVCTEVINANCLY